MIADDPKQWNKPKLDDFKVEAVAWSDAWIVSAPKSARWPFEHIRIDRAMLDMLANETMRKYTLQAVEALQHHLNKPQP
jgi:hypothetical protein